jgi:TolB-like protein/Tfp pilus assembly protein PilF
MKRCPECGREYDPSMMFCLDDGAELLYGPAASDEPATVILDSFGVTPSEATRSYDRTTTAEAEPSTTLGGSTEKQSLSAHRAAQPQEVFESSAEKQSFSAHRAAKPLGAAILLILLLAGGFFGYRYFASASSKQISSIAVMPFVNGSNFPEDEYLADGMTESLIRTLSQLPGLNVKSRSSVFRYKGKETDAKTIARELGVDAIVSGRITQRSDGLMLDLELVETATENVLWAERYDRKSSDLISLQNEIARDVSTKLKSKLSGDDQEKLAKSYTTNPEAYRLYLQGRFYWNKRDESSFRKAIDYFAQAVAIDPNYALAYAGLADSYVLLSTFGFLPQPEGMPKAQEFARRAMSIDDSLAEPHASLAVTFQSYEYDFAAAEREYRKAIDLNPKYLTGHQWYGEFLVCSGRFDEAAASYRRAIELDPLSIPANWEYARSFYYARKFDESIEGHKKVLEMDAQFQGAYRTLAEAYRVKGDYANAAETQARFFDLGGEAEKAALVRNAFAKDGWRGVLKLMTADHSALKFRHAVIARAYIELGDKDKAFEELNKGFELREAPLQWLKVEPQFDPLRGDPRFKELMRKMNFSE